VIPLSDQTDEVFGTHMQATAGVSKRAQQADAQAAPKETR